MKDLVLFLGNPNSGKTTLFNALTGLHGKVGNYPGITVEAKEALVINFPDLKIVDLPGTYSLFPTQEDEDLTIKALMGNIKSLQNFKLVVIVIDAGSLRRGAYLYLQLIELGFKTIIAITFTDEHKNFQDPILIKELSKITGTFVVAIDHQDPKSLNTLKHTMDGIVKGSLKWELALVPKLYKEEDKHIVYSIFEKYDFEGVDFIKKSPKSEHILINRKLYIYGLFKRNRFSINFKEEPYIDELISTWPENRFALVDDFLKKIEKKLPRENKLFKLSTYLDKFFLHPIFGVMFAVFIFFLALQIIFVATSPMVEFLNDIISYFSEYIINIFPLNSLFADLLSYGFLKGLGSVLAFLPMIATLFFLQGILEDSGYLARVTLLFDKWLKKLGLCGKSLMPMLSGFACSVPAIMAARNIPSKRARLITMLSLPFLTCSARIPVFVLIISSLFDAKKGAFLFVLMYVLGILASFLTSFVLSKVLVKTNEQADFSLELVPFRMPKFKPILLSVKDRVLVFLRDVGGIILSASIIMWALFRLKPSFGIVRALNIEESFAGSIGHFLLPIFKPLGFDWPIVLGILGSFLAREVFISTMAIVYGLDAFKASLTPLSGLSLLVFFALSMQCVSTFFVLRRESGSLFWPTLQFFFMTASAYLASLLVYSIGRILCGIY